MPPPLKLKKQTTLTYRGDKSTSKYQSLKIFPEVFQVFGWIHKKGKASRPNKNKAKGAARTCAQKNASKKRKKK